jgi:hypothetical protein
VTVKVLPEPILVAPQLPEYHFQIALYPKEPGLITDNVLEDPMHVAEEWVILPEVVLGSNITSCFETQDVKHAPSARKNLVPPLKLLITIESPEPAGAVTPGILPQPPKNHCQFAPAAKLPPTL